MDSKERAEKALPDILLEHLPKGWIVSLRRDIAAQIEEAQRGAYEQFRKDYRWACQCQNVDCQLEAEIISRGARKLEQKGYAEGFRAAREKAKGIVLDWDRVHAHDMMTMQEQIAKRIGEMEP